MTNSKSLRGEGHLVEWKTLEGDERNVYVNTKLILTRDSTDWQPYKPNAEREGEGLYYDSALEFTIPCKDRTHRKSNPLRPISICKQTPGTPPGHFNKVVRPSQVYRL